MRFSNGRTDVDMIERRVIRFSFVMMMFLSLPGCAKPPRTDRPPTYPAAGRVLVAGQPAAGAQVQLWAVDGDLKRAEYCPHGTVGDDGSFQLTTYATGDGAPQGEYALTLRWPAPPPSGREEGPDRFQGRYADPLMPIRTVRIMAAENMLEAIELE